MEKKYYEHFIKEAGGPGSGVEGDNVEEIDFLETSPLISIGYRTEFMSERSPVQENVMIDTDKIKYKGQENFVPKKLNKFIDAFKKGETWMFDKAVDVLKDDDGHYHIIDGHHRGLAAIKLKRPELKVNVYTMDNIVKEATESALKEVFLRKATSDKDRERLNVLWGMSSPTRDGSERIDLDAEKQRNRPEAFQ